MRSTALLILVPLGCAVDPTSPRATAPRADLRRTRAPARPGVQTCEAPGELGACVCPDAGSAWMDVAAADTPRSP